MVNKTIFNDIENQISLENIWKYSVNEKFAVALWRLPVTNSLHFLIDFSGKPKKMKVDLEDNISGFCLSPFLNAEGTETLFLKNDIHLIFNENGRLNNEIELTINDKLFIEKAKEFNIESNFRKKQKLISIIFQKEGKINFEKMVNNAVVNILNGGFQKVVLSRCKKVQFDSQLDIFSTISKLCLKYSKAFVSAIYLPEIETIWIGASPELLVSLDSNGLFKTMSLAGTQSAFGSDGRKILLNNARWSQKEIEEQAFVSRYIIECFKKVRVREYSENGPKTVEAGNLLHLQTDFTVDTNAIEFSQFTSVLLSLLHPTSAVCGMPKEPALGFIEKNEGYERDFYSGFLGPINIEKQTHIFVNLRTLKLHKNEAYLYAGAGITEDSIAENEWLETEMKMDTLLSILND